MAAALLAVAAVEGGKATVAIVGVAMEFGAAVAVAGLGLAKSADRGTGSVAAAALCDGGSDVEGVALIKGVGLIVGRAICPGVVAIVPVPVALRTGGVVACARFVAGCVTLGRGTTTGAGRSASAALLRGGALPRIGGPSSTDRTVGTGIDGAGSDDGGAGV